MPAAVSEDTSSVKVDRSEQMRNVLKAHILRERARKRQELEAKVEEERLRKEREAREQQDVMTLGETREQISQLEAKLTELKDEKHQLFLQLKKVLNEDDNRRRQMLKENSEVMSLSQPPETMLNVVTLMHQQQQMYHNPVPQIQTKATVKQYKAPVKRPRSPSPPPVIPISLYHQGYRYKTPTDYAPPPNPPPPAPPKDDGRRNELVRAVLWNKAAPQYNSQPIAFYPMPPQELSSYYPMPTPREQTRNVYEPPRPQAFHIDQKMHDHYAMQRNPPTHGPVIHGGPIPISSVQSVSKTGSITAGYPVRSQPQYQPQPPPPSSAYTAHIRSFGQPPGAPLNHPSQRD